MQYLHRWVGHRKPMKIITIEQSGRRIGEGNAPYWENNYRDAIIHDRRPSQILFLEPPEQEETPGDEEHDENPCELSSRGEIEPGLPAPLPVIGQTPAPDSDKQRLAFRTEADSEGWRAGLPWK
jgi:hypothetical protein